MSPREFTAISPALETNDIGRTLSADGRENVVLVPDAGDIRTFLCILNLSFQS